MSLARDPQIFAHYWEVKDAVTHKLVTQNTQIANFHDPRKGFADDDRLLANLTRPSQPAV